MITYILVSVCVILVYFLNWLQNEKYTNEPPVFHRSVPLIGHTHRLIGSANHMFKLIEEAGEDSQKKGGIMRCYLMGYTFYFLTDPEDSLTLVTECLAKADYYDLVRPWIGDSLIITNVDKWKRNRKILTPAFNQNILDGFFDTFNQQSNRLVNDFDTKVGKGFFDQTGPLKLNALESICLTVLGIDFQHHTILTKQYIEASTKLFAIVMRRIQLLLLNDWMFSLSSLKKRHDQYIEILQNVTDTVLKKRKLEMKQNIESENLGTKSLGKKFKTFMELLLEMDSMTDQEIRNELNLMMFASHDTTAKSMVFVLYLIAKNPKVQRKLHDEVDAVLGDSTECVIDKLNIRKLVYLEAVIKEAIRLFPIVPIILRNVDKDVILKNYTITKGKYAFIYLNRLNRHPMWGTDAEEFRPERWLEPGGVPDNAAAFASFSIGRRNCIGKTYAMMTMKVTLAHIIRHFEIISENTKFEVKLDLMLQPDIGHHIAVKRRIKETVAQ